MKKMVDPLDKEIDVDEIMERIREEVRRRRGLPETETYQGSEQLPSNLQPILPIPVPPQPTQQISGENSIDHFRWIDERKYKKIIKKLPIISSLAQKKHQRLSQKFISLPQTSPPNYSSPVNFNVLHYYINYHGFLEHAKREEGIKGWLKYHLFKTIRYFGWWQEQINRALYQELINQKEKMSEREIYFKELLQQQVNHLTEELNKRDSLFGELNRHLISLIQSREEIHQKLESQKVRMEALEKQFREVQIQHFTELKVMMDKRVKLVEDKLSTLNQKIKEIKREIDTQDKIREEIYDRLSHFQQVSEKTDQKLSLQEKHLNEFEKNIKQLLNQRLEAIGTGLKRAHDQLKNNIDFLNHQLSTIVDLKSNLSNIFYEMLKKEEKLSDVLYFDFENLFRGTRREVKQRLSIYLPYAKEAAERTGKWLALDLGCGRGEWVELLKENGFMVKGVDSNRIMVKECQAKGLDVIEQDVIEYLNHRSSNWFSVVTGFHLLEHLSIREILSVLQEAFRVLLPGGIVIFETPNPENVMVATHFFHLDPTHRHLLPPNLLNFLVQSVGFKKSEIMKLRHENFIKEEENDSANIKLILSMFNKELDYSVVGYKE